MKSGIPNGSNTLPNNRLYGERDFFLDSYTYTPFIDYSQSVSGRSPRVGVYSDQFLTDYNLGRYDDDYGGEGGKIP